MQILYLRYASGKDCTLIADNNNISKAQSLLYSHVLTYFIIFDYKSKDGLLGSALYDIRKLLYKKQAIEGLSHFTKNNIESRINFITNEWLENLLIAADGSAVKAAELSGYTRRAIERMRNRYGIAIFSKASRRKI